MIYYIGLVFVIIIVIFSFDDIIWDVFYLFYKLSGKLKEEKIPIKDIKKVTPKLLAVVIAAYNEEDVLEDVIENLVRSQEYPRSMYHLFIGVYPNDPATKEIAMKLEKKYKHIHSITHVLNGPSSKADNINNVIENIYKYEKTYKVRFNGVIIHDSEDVVHPYEFMLENYLFQTKEAIQIPVFPLQEMPKIKNFFKNMVTGTYADEFAENHFRTLNIRNATNSFVPSAGTGFALRRDVLDSFDDHNIFPVGSLTEDFKLSLQLKEKGFDVYYPLEKITRINYKKQEKTEYIATRSMFPKTFKAAVKQKTRWIYGITMQTFKMWDVLKSKNINFRSKYSLFKDWKAKFVNLFILPGYMIFLYFLVSLFVDIPIMYPKYSFSWYLLIVLSILMIEKQILRFTAVKKVYGYKSAFISSFLPPLLPFRWLVGNLINFTATVKAWIMKVPRNKIVKEKKKGKKTKPKWSKTDHEFLDEAVLQIFRRKLGDDLLRKELISPEDLSKALEKAESDNKRIGETIIEMGLLTEKDMIKSLASVNHKQFLNISLGNFPKKYNNIYDEAVLKKVKAIPIFEEDDVITVVTTVNANLGEIKEIFNKNIDIVYTLNDRIKDYFNGKNTNEMREDQLSTIEKLIEKNLISARHGVIALRHTEKDEDIIKTLKSMGFLHNVLV